MPRSWKLHDTCKWGGPKRYSAVTPEYTTRSLPQHNLNVIHAISLILDTFLNLLCVWKYVEITLRSTAVVWRLHAFLSTQCYLKIMKVTIHKFTVADSFNSSQFNRSSIKLRWDCTSKAAFSKWRWLSVKMMFSFASLTNEIVKPLIIVQAAFVLVSLLLRWKLRADSSLELGSLTKQTVNSSS